MHVLHLAAIQRRPKFGLRLSLGLETECLGLVSSGPIYKISYDLSYDYRKLIVRSTNDSDLQRAKISFRNITGLFTNIISDDLTILQVNRT